jgi:hypothetical protein
MRELLIARFGGFIGSAFRYWTCILKTVDELFEAANCGGLVTLERVEIVKYTHSKK